MALSPQLGRSGSPERPPRILPPVLIAATRGVTVTLERTQHTTFGSQRFQGGRGTKNACKSYQAAGDLEARTPADLTVRKGRA